MGNNISGPSTSRPIWCYFMLAWLGLWPRLLAPQMRSKSRSKSVGMGMGREVAYSHANHQVASLTATKRTKLQGDLPPQFVQPPLKNVGVGERFSICWEILSLAWQEIISCLDSLFISKFLENLPGLPYGGFSNLPLGLMALLWQRGKWGYVSQGESSSFCNI